MLEIQRDKFELRNRLKKAGATDDEINQRLNEGHRPFRPAFVNGQRVVGDYAAVRMNAGPENRSSMGF